MPQLVVMSAKASCSFGTMPATLTVIPAGPPVQGGGQAVATIMDDMMPNLATFGMCSGPSNPQVIAAQGSPVPCLPVIVAPWSPGSSTVTVGGKPALTDNSMCNCTWAGVIQISSAGQTTVTVGS